MPGSSHGTRTTGTVGVVLMAEGLGHHIPKGYIYFAMAFSLGVEMLNIRFRKRAKNVVHLHQQQP
jgi:predicted tellurium resistance membrane protein TerC